MAAEVAVALAENGPTEVPIPIDTLPGAGYNL